MKNKTSIRQLWAFSIISSIPNSVFLRLILVFIFVYVSPIHILAQESNNYFKIRVVDEKTERGVPLVELKTTNEVRYYTDNNGIIAFYEPGLMGGSVYFSITSPGYEFPGDFFGNPGKAFKVTKGDSVCIKIKRINVAERLYRYTGEGLYHHSLLVGHPVPVKQPVINAQVTGLDGTMALPYNGKIYWTWGDTENISSSIGHFAVSGATSELTGNGGLDPDNGIDLTFFVNENGFSIEMCPVPGPGMVWNHWMGVLPDESGKERLILHYGRMKDLSIVLESGLAVFNEEKNIFEPIFQYSPDLPFWPKGHYLVADVNGQNYHYFSFRTPYSLRAIADLKHIKDIQSYEAFTCLKEGTKYKGALSEIDRNKNGDIIYSWKKGTDPVDYRQQKLLIENGLINQEEGWLQLCNIENGTEIASHAGSVYWNEYRKRWIMIMQGTGASSGDIWYGESDTPVGPWVYLKRIATHNKYSFYNPTQLPFFDKDNGRYIYFDGTFSTSFTSVDYKIPRYDYNLIMYRLDLDDPRLYLPAPVYCISNKEGLTEYYLRESVDSLDIWRKIDEIPFFVFPPDRKIDGAVAIYQNEEDGHLRLDLKPSLERTTSGNPVFYGLPLFDTEDEKLKGTWKCKADDFPLVMDVTMNGENMNISFDNKDLSVTDVKFVNDTVVIKVKDHSDEAEYIIASSIQEGSMDGNVIKLGTEENFNWGGERMDALWKLTESKAVVPLYEYQKEDGVYYYSTDPGLQHMKRTERPVCQVWKNPFTTLILDYDTKPVPILP